MMATSRRLRTWGLRCTVLFAALAFALIAGEVVLWIADVSFPLPYAPDDNTGSRLRPGWSGWFNTEGRAFVTINQQGFRDRDHARQKPADTIRILVLGDSFVEALQLPMEQAFWSVLERRLQEQLTTTGKRVEVIAMGVSGWGTAQECLALEHYGEDYSPDVVLVAYCTGNDLRNNSKTLEPDAVRPFLQWRDNGWELDESFRQHPRFLRAKSPWTKFKVACIRHSRLLQGLQRWRSMYREAAAPAGVEAGLDDMCFLEPSTPAWLEAWDTTERLLVRMNDSCRLARRQFCVALVTSGIQVTTDAAARQAYQQRLGVAALDYTDRRISVLGQSHGFPVVVLSEPMREYAHAHQVWLHGFANTKWGEGHWNEAGHRLAGDIIARHLAPLLQPPAAAASEPAPATSDNSRSNAATEARRLK